MKKNLKIMIIVLGLLIVILLIDTVQAKLFNNKPIFKVVENYNGGTLYQKHKGLLVDTYIYTDGIKKTIFKWDEEYDYVLDSQNYVSVFHGEDGNIVYETYIYKIPNGQGNYGFNYVNVTKTYKENNKWERKITSHGSVEWTDNVFKVAKENGAYSYVTLPGNDKKYTIEEYKKMFLMN